MSGTPKLDLVQRDDAGVIDVHLGDRVVWSYRYKETPKPHVFYFATPSGENTTLASPPHHVHHRGLMFACTVNDTNFWEESPSPGLAIGEIVHKSWSALTCTGDEAVAIEHLRWMNGDTALLAEERTLKLHHDAAAGAIVCDWTTRLQAQDQPVSINGRTPASKTSYHGLGFRFSRALDIGGKHAVPKDFDAAATGQGVPARWRHYQGHGSQHSYEPAGVFISDYPLNPRHPTPWFVLSHPPAPFAFLSASLVAREPWMLQPGGRVTLRYCVAVHDGEWDVAACENAWRKYPGTSGG